MKHGHDDGFDHRGARRRRLLAAGLALAAGGQVLLPRRALARSSAPRRLSFHHLHTNEKISVVYYADGRYLEAALVRVTRLLRDFRTGEVHPIDPRLYDFLHAARAAIGSRGVFEVISGYRSPATNEMLRRTSTGVARRSLHTKGMAIDVRLTDVDTRTLRDAAKILRRGGVGYYRKSDFVHLDTGRVRSW